MRYAINYYNLVFCTFMNITIYVQYICNFLADINGIFRNKCRHLHYKVYLMSVPRKSLRTNDSDAVTSSHLVRSDIF